MHKPLPKLLVFLDQYNDQLFKNNITNLGIVYRNYNNKQRYKNLIKIAKACKIRKYQLFVSNDLNLAIKVKADGYYIPSFNTSFTNILNTGKKNFQIIGSAHSQKELKQKMNQKCNAILLSPLFKSKKNKNDFGTVKFNLFTLKNNINFFALGGIKEKNFSKLKMLNVKGIAGISIFQKKTGLKLGRFFKNNFK